MASSYTRALFIVAATGITGGTIGGLIGRYSNYDSFPQQVGTINVRWDWIGSGVGVVVGDTAAIGLLKEFIRFRR